MSQFKVLVVDDEESSREMIAFILKREGYEVATAGNGTEALTAINKQKPDLVITDFKMAKMDGIELLREIKKTSRDIDVIITTAYGGMDTYLQAMDLDVSECMNKPFRHTDMVKVVKKIKNKKENSELSA